MFNLFNDYPLLVTVELEIAKAKLRQKVVGKLKAVIFSCKTYKQLSVAKRMLNQQVRAKTLSAKSIDYLDSIYVDKLRELSQ